MKSSNRIHQGTMRTVAAVLLAVGLTACAGLTQPSQQDRLAKAQAMFAERCKTAGEKIYRTVDNVEGIYLLKLRPTQNFGGQFDLDDPYGHDSSGENYIKVFFTEFYQIPSIPPQGWKRRTGYEYVEAIEEQDGKRYRYTGVVKAVGKKDPTSYNIQVELKRNPGYDLNIYAFTLEKRLALGPAPRYGLTYEDISTREEREYWIAGSSLKVIDLQTSEVIAERVGYMMDSGQGSRAGGRAPWLMAAYTACPSFPRDPGGHVYQTDQTHDFVVKVLKPKQEPGRLE